MAEDVLGPGDDRYAIFEHLLEGVQVLDFEGRYLYLNETAISHSRSDRKSLLGRRMAECYPGIDQTEFYPVMLRALNERKPERMRNPFTYPDGTVGTFELHMSPVPGGLLILSYDVSAQTALEERLRQAERLESVGRMAGGVAHDFNNLLTVMVGYADLLRQGGRTPALDREAIDQILAAGSRASELTNQLLSFSRSQVLQPKLLDLNGIVHEVGTMIGRLLNPGTELALKTSAQPQWLLADPGQMRQLVMNLALNARDAMPAGGRLSLETRACHLLQADLSPQGGLAPGDYVELQVSDTGEGHDERSHQDLFEPFFGAQGGAGTRLGLATVQSIVKRSKGSIRVDSLPGQGSSFVVRLPGTLHAEALPAPGKKAVGPSPQGIRVLVVDDEAIVLKLFVHVLTQAGYQVTCALDAHSALELASKTKAGFDLLLSDISLPDRNGRLLAKDIKALHPHIKVVFTSGYAGPAAMGLGDLAPEETFIGKPVAPSKLLQRLAEALDLA